MFTDCLCTSIYTPHYRPQVLELELVRPSPLTAGEISATDRGEPHGDTGGLGAAGIAAIAVTILLVLATVTAVVLFVSY